VFFEDQDFDSGASQEKAEDHPGGSASSNAAAHFHRRGFGRHRQILSALKLGKTL
jgi:hypothetical protein